MSGDSFSETTSTGWLQRLGQAIGGVLVGFLLFIVSFPLLFWNEGRAVQTAKSLDEGAAVVVSVSADAVDPAKEGKLVHLSAEAIPHGELVDPELGAAAKAISLRRVVEIYQWKEEQKTETRKKLGGGEERVTTYDYKRDWSHEPIDSSRFKKPDDHRNMGAKPFADETWKEREVKLGSFSLSPAQVGRIPGEERLPVTTEMQARLPADLQGRLRVRDGYYYQSLAKPVADAPPQVGDVRISYHVVKPTVLSIVARQVGTTFEPYQATAGARVDLLQAGTHSAAAMFQSAQSANTFLTWILRLVGFVVMAVGIGLICRPLVVMADVIPLLGNLLSLGVSVFAGGIAFVLSLATIALGWIFYRPVLGIGLLAVAGAGFVGLYWVTGRKRGDRAVNPV